MPEACEVPKRKEVTQLLTLLNLLNSLNALNEREVF